MSKKRFLIAIISIGMFASTPTYAMENKEKPSNSNTQNEENLISNSNTQNSNKQEENLIYCKNLEEIKNDYNELEFYKSHFNILKNVPNIYGRDNMYKMDEIKERYIENCDDVDFKNKTKKEKEEIVDNLIKSFPDVLSKQYLKGNQEEKIPMFSLNQLKKDIITAVKKMNKIENFKYRSQKDKPNITDVRDAIKELLQKYYTIDKKSRIGQLENNTNNPKDYSLQYYINVFNNKYQWFFQNLKDEGRIEKYKKAYIYLLKDALYRLDDLASLRWEIIKRIAKGKKYKNNLYIYQYKFIVDNFIEKFIELMYLNGVDYFEQTEKFASIFEPFNLHIKPWKDFRFYNLCKEIYPMLKKSQDAMNEKIEDLFSDENIKQQNNFKYEVRKDNILEGFENYNDIKDILDKAENEVKNILNKAENEIKDILNKAKNEIKTKSNKEIKDILNKAKDEVKRKSNNKIKNILNKAENEIKDILNKSKNEIKTENNNDIKNILNKTEN